jgi:putative NADH-flavin reductase
MKICIFGADGRTGVEVVKYAKEKGYDVVAFVYNENSNKYLPEGIEIKKGDVMDYTKVTDAIKGTDAVISVLGHIKGSDLLMQTKGMENIVNAMKENGTRRVLSLTGTGARVAGDTPSLIDTLLNFIVKLVDPDRINDGVKHVEVLKNSGLDFTVVRVLKLSKSDELFNGYKLTDGGPAELQTSRKKAAQVLVDLVSDNTYINKFPVISK